MQEPAIVPLYFRLPHPPSTNSIWRGGKGGRHYLSAKYKAWREEAFLMVKADARGKRIAGPFAVQINARRPDKRKRDIDNLIKPVLDLIALAGVTDDDSECQMVEAQWIERGVGLWVAVRPTTRWGAEPWTIPAQHQTSTEPAP